jgi:hypothetical protein
MTLSIPFRMEIWNRVVTISNEAVLNQGWVGVDQKPFQTQSLPAKVRRASDRNNPLDAVSLSEM